MYIYMYIYTHTCIIIWMSISICLSVSLVLGVERCLLYTVPAVYIWWHMSMRGSNRCWQETGQCSCPSSTIQVSSSSLLNPGHGTHTPLQPHKCTHHPLFQLLVQRGGGGGFVGGGGWVSGWVSKWVSVSLSLSFSLSFSLSRARAGGWVDA